MSTITLQDHGIPVTLPDGLSEEQLLSFKPFNTWVSTLTASLALQSRTPSHPFHASPYRLHAITIQAYDLFGPRRVGFLKAVADVSNDEGASLPAAVFLRGPSVAMLVTLVPDDARPDSDERYALLTVQPRVAAGSLAFVELPAGMVDDEGSFAGVAAKEIREELGMDIRADQLTCLSALAAALEAEAQGPNQAPHHGGERGENLPCAMYPSAGACDEHITIYSHERRVPRAQLETWSGRLTGLRDEGERITLMLVPFAQLWRAGARDAKCLAALALYEGLKREGRL
ncbi:Nudix hydrolase 14 like protein [Verticillium longisporum]|uniref:Nudix hydrolase 14 like protein n=1 Tax=Verticillium longisporum TaxID=100787 RepID=A0A8I2ZTF1_VERLO|nr:Nudix hydrolase 14 like protein [Verticillium longisporum]KAG7138559.1 Nudix hydrolase 14 like protein [Verticillium longisporum]